MYDKTRRLLEYQGEQSDWIVPRPPIFWYVPKLRKKPRVISEATWKRLQHTSKLYSMSYLKKCIGWLAKNQNAHRPRSWTTCERVEYLDNMLDFITIAKASTTRDWAVNALTDEDVLKMVKIISRCWSNQKITGTADCDAKAACPCRLTLIEIVYSSLIPLDMSKGIRNLMSCKLVQLVTVSLNIASWHTSDTSF